MNENEHEKKPEDGHEPAAAAAATPPESPGGPWPHSPWATPAEPAAPLTDAAPEPMPEAEATPEAAPESEAAPLRIYEYRFVRVKQNAWESVEPAILGAGAAAVAAAGGQLYGVWLGQIGLSANQGVVVTVWPDLESAKRHGERAIADIAEVAASETLYLEPTARPADATPPDGPGIFAHRLFEVRRSDADRFVAMSDEAWPQFEAVFGARVFALWREVGHDRANERLILLTRYPDYAAWEKSRYWQPEPDANAAAALQGFRERREITVDTVVYTTRLASSAVF